MNKKIILLVVVTFSLLFASCVTLMKGTEQTITIDSNVEGAELYLDGIMIGTTPFVGMIKKNKESLRIVKDGYRSHTLIFSKNLEPIFWGNIISGGTLGSITDFATGAAYSYSPASYQVELYREGEESGAFLQRFELRQYALLYITDISIDLGNDGGEYLETLIRLSDLPYNKQSIELIRSKFNNSNGNEIVFGKEVVKLLDT